jgi:formylglycine-generating enzyme required for sulfatase activity
MPRRIELALDDKTRIPFILVPQQAAGEPESFYIMEQKVTNGLFGQFAEAHPEKLRDSQWDLGGQAGSRSTGKNEQFPVLRVTGEEARQFAEWLGGQLPSPEQWDRAAGFQAPDGRQGPFVGTWGAEGNPKIGVRRRKEGPMPVAEESDDISPLGVRGMAGNGREWTHTLLDGKSERDAAALVILRGRSYTAPAPLFYSDIKYEQEMPQTQFYSHASPFTGFRLVLELP